MPITTTARDIEIRIRWTCRICGRTKKNWCKVIGETERYVNRTDFSLKVEPLPAGWQEFKNGQIVCEKHIEDL